MAKDRRSASRTGDRDRVVGRGVERGAEAAVEGAVEDLPLDVVELRQAALDVEVGGQAGDLLVEDLDAGDVELAMDLEVAAVERSADRIELPLDVVKNRSVPIETRLSARTTRGVVPPAAGGFARLSRPSQVEVRP